MINALKIAEGGGGGETAQEEGGRDRSLLFAECVRKPIQTFVETVAGRGGGTLDVPLSVAELVQAQPLGDLLWVAGE